MTSKSEEPRFFVTLGELPVGLAPIPIAKMGTYYKGKQKFSITDADIAALVENFRKRENGEVPIDYEHASEWPEFAQGGPIPAAGWLKEIDERPDKTGILWGRAEFTEKARQMIAGKEYKYLSPALHWDVRDKRTGELQGATLTSVALVNRPFLEAMPAIALSDGWVVETATEKEKTNMVTKLVLADRAACKVRAVLADGTETVLAVEGLAAEPKIVRLSDVKRTSDGRFDFIALSDTQEGTLIDPAVVRAMNVQSELDAAVREGRITPAQRPKFEKIALSDIDTFREVVASLRQVDLSERGITGADAVDPEKAIATLVAEKKAARPALGDAEARTLVLSEHPDLKAKVEGATNPRQAIAGLVKAKLAADSKLGYESALRIVLSERPDLAERRQKLMPGKEGN